MAEQMSNLEFYILTYKRNPSDEMPVCNIFDFYNTYMLNKMPRWNREFGVGSKRILCFNPDHDDAKPSMGAFKSNKINTYMYHCFGCNCSGNVVDMYIIFTKIKEHLTITRENACMALAKLYDIPLDDGTIDNIANEKQNEAFANWNKAVAENNRGFTKEDYANVLRNSRRNRDGTVADLDKIVDSYVLFVGGLKNMSADNYKKQVEYQSEEDAYNEQYN